MRRPAGSAHPRPPSAACSCSARSLPGCRRSTWHAIAATGAVDCTPPGWLRSSVPTSRSCWGSAPRTSPGCRWLHSIAWCICGSRRGQGCIGKTTLLARLRRLRGQSSSACPIVALIKSNVRVTSALYWRVTNGAKPHPTECRSGRVNCGTCERTGATTGHLAGTQGCVSRSQTRKAPYLSGFRCGWKRIGRRVTHGRYGETGRSSSRTSATRPRSITTTSWRTGSKRQAYIIYESFTARHILIARSRNRSPGWGNWRA